MSHNQALKFKTLNHMIQEVDLYRTKTEPEILIFKTDISTDKAVEVAGKILNCHFFVKEWSVDTEDVDNVLRVVTAGHLSESNIIKMLRINGFSGEVLH